MTNSVPSETSATIRPATASDLPLLLQLIRELAAYERLEHCVVADGETLGRSLFGSRPAAEAIVGEWNDQTVGFAVFFQNFSTFLGRPGIYLEDLFIRPEFRGRGFGKQMLIYLAAETLRREGGRLEWAVLNWNEPAIKFYESLGAQPMSDWQVYRLSGQALLDLSTHYARI